MKNPAAAQKETMKFPIYKSGIYGKIKELEDNVVVLEIAPSVKIRIDRNSIFADVAATQNNAK